MAALAAIALRHSGLPSRLWAHAGWPIPAVLHWTFAMTHLAAFVFTPWICWLAGARTGCSSAMFRLVTRTPVRDRLALMSIFRNDLDLGRPGLCTCQLLAPQSCCGGGCRRHGKQRASDRDLGSLAGRVSGTLTARKSRNDARQNRLSEPPLRFSAQHWAAFRVRFVRSTVPVGGGRSPRSLGGITRL